MSTTKKPNAGFWIIAIIALLWNIMGVIQYLSATYMKEEMHATMTEQQVALMESLPSWHIGIFAIAVFTGFLASILLLLRKKWAVNTFLVSLVAILIQMGYWFFGTEAIDVYGSGVYLMPILVIVIGVFLYFYSKSAVQKGLLK
jgi:hypothetical protein